MYIVFLYMYIYSLHVYNMMYSSQTCVILVHSLIKVIAPSRSWFSLFAVPSSSTVIMTVRLCESGLFLLEQ